jgi:hypothetical protein
MFAKLYDRFQDETSEVFEVFGPDKYLKNEILKEFRTQALQLFSTR